MLLFAALGIMGYLLWTMQQRLEAVAIKLAALQEKVKDGEHVIIENFEIVEKRFAKLEHEIKDSKHSEIGQRRKEILQAAKALRTATDE